MTCWEVLRITNGTDTVNLRSSGDTGYICCAWRPSFAALKDGGVWLDSPLADGRRLAMAYYQNMVQTLTLQLNAYTTDDLYHYIQDLERLLIQARNYWKSGGVSDFVWLEMQGRCESEMRYALVKNGRWGDTPFPFDAPVAQDEQTGLVAMPDIELVLELGPAWTENQPGVGTQIPIGTAVEFNSQYFGNVNPSTGEVVRTTDPDVYLANYRADVQPTHIFRYDASTGTYSANLLGTALPYNLFPSPPAVGDILYIGVQSSVADGGPFSNVVFNIGTAGSDYDVQVEVGTGGGWTIIGANSTWSSGFATDAFITTGSGVISWYPGHTRPTDIVNGITGWWVRIRVTAVGGAPSAPQQAEYHPYFAGWPYIDIEDGDVGGNIPALAELIVRNVSGQTSSLPGRAARVIQLALRSRSRGEDFTPFLNIADEQNPSGVTVVGSFADYGDSPTGRGLASSAGSAYIQMTPALARAYLGRFHAYVRGNFDAGVTVTDAQVRLRVSYGASATNFTAFYDVTADPLSGIGGNVWGLVWDLGQFEIRPCLENDDFSLQFTVGIFSDSGAFHVHDLILWPVDEWAAQFQTAYSTDLAIGLSSLTQPHYLDVDSVRCPVQDLRSFSVNEAAGVYSIWQAIAAGPAILQAEGAQRLYALSRSPTDVADPEESNVGTVHRVSLYKQARYRGGRGSR